MLAAASGLRAVSPSDRSLVAECVERCVDVLRTAGIDSFGFRATEVLVNLAGSDGGLRYQADCLRDIIEDAFQSASDRYVYSVITSYPERIASIAAFVPSSAEQVLVVLERSVLRGRGVRVEPGINVVSLIWLLNVLKELPVSLERGVGDRILKL